MMLVSLISYVDRNTLALLIPTIMKETGLSANAYKNARRRLDFILLQLPTETRDAVMAAFTN